MTESISRKFSKLGSHVSATGTITTNAATASAWETARTLTLSGDLSGNVSISGAHDITLTATVSGNSITLGTDTTGDYVASVTAGTGITTTGTGEGAAVTVALSASGVTANSYGSSTAVPVLTIDTYGRITSASTASVSSSINIAGDTGTDSVSLISDTLTVSGGTGLTSTVTNNTVTLDIDNTVTTLTGSQTLTNKTISGSNNTITNIGNGSLTNSSITINGASIALGASGTLVTDDVAEDASPVNLWFTNTRARNAVSATDAGGDGSFTYDSGTGVFTYTGPSATEVRAHLSAGTGLTYSTGQFAIDSTVVTLTGTQTLNNKTLTAPVISSITNTGTLTLPTSTDTLVGRATTDTLTNKTISGADNTISNIGNASLTNSTITINGTAVSLGGTRTLVTDDVAEDGSPTNLWYTDARTRSAISVTDAGGDGSLGYNSGTGVITYTGPSASEVRAHFSAGTGVTITNGEVAIGQAVGTSSNVTFNDVIVSGNLTVSGTTTTINTETLNLADNIVVFNSNETGTPSQDAGIEIERGTSPNVSLLWDEANDRWTIGSQNFLANTFIGALSGNATTATTWATGRTLTLSGDVTGTSAAFDGSGNISISTTIAADSVALGTDTTGNYVASITNGNYITGGDGGSEGATLTLAVDATSANTASKVVARDASGNFSAGTITATLSGNATTATTLQTARNINGVSFNGSADITVADSTKLPLSGGTISAGSGYPLTLNTTQRYVMWLRNTNSTGTGWWLAHESGSLIFHANAIGDLASLSSAGTFNATNLTSGGNQVLHAGNYNSYAPTLTGTGASGTWGISISGNAATATSATTAGALSSMNISQFTNNSGYITGLSFDGLSGKTGGTGTYTTSGDFRAPIFYDSNDTTYYVDPNGYSSMSTARFWGNAIYVRGSSPTVYFTDADEMSAMIHVNSNLFYILRGGVDSTSWTQVNSQWPLVINLSNNNATFGATVTAVSDFRAPIFYDSNDTGYYFDGASTSALNYVNAGGGTNSSGNSMYDAYVDGNSAYFHTPQFRVRRDSSATGAIDQAPVALFLHNENGTNNTWVKLSMGGREAAGSGNTVSWAGIAARKTSGTANSWASGELHLWTKSGGAQNTGMFIATSGYAQSDYSFRAPIFYDSNDTGHYFDGASTSRLNAISANNTYINAGYMLYSDPGGWTGEYNKIQWHSSHMYFQNMQNGYWIFRRSNGSEPFLLHADGWGQASGDWRAPIFYDSNDTAFYLNPAGGSRLRNLYVGDSGDDWSDPGGWGTQIRFSNGPHVKFVLHARSPGIEAGMYVHTPSSVYIGSYSSHDVSLMYAGSRKMGFNASYIYTDVYLEAAGSLRAPIFYDSNNTAYYTDPAGTARLSYVVANGGIRIDGNENLYLDYNYGCSIVGVYTSTRYQGVFAMGNSYKLPIDGSGPGNLYGLTWSHPNAGGVAGNLNDHGLLVLINGGYAAALSSSIRAASDMRAPIFYDANNTGYYTDPASTSRLNYAVPNRIKLVNNVDYEPRWDFTAYVVEAQHWYGNNASMTMYIGESSNTIQVPGSGGIRPTIVYDYNNTGYYCDPSSTSQLSYVLANDWFRPQGSTGLYFQDYGYGLRSAHGEGNSYGNATTYGTGRNGWSGWGIGTRHVFMSTTGDNVGVHDNSRGWIWYWNGSYIEFPYGYTIHAGSSRAPIFYDQNDTGYYCDPASTSYMYRTIFQGRMLFYGADQSADGTNDAQIYFTPGGGLTIASITTSFETGFVGSSYPQNRQVGAQATYDKRFYVWQDLVQYYSDERLKEKTGTLVGALDAIKSWTPFKYVDNALANSFNFGSDKPQIGLSAQEVQQYYPELVELAPFDVQNDFSDETNPRRVSKSGENYLTLNYTRLVPVLVQAIKEQQAKIEELERRINNS